MSHLPGIRARDLIKILEKLDFEAVRQKGSHLFFKHNDGRTTIVPMHSGEEISRGLLRQILREIDLTPEEFLDLI